MQQKETLSITSVYFYTQYEFHKLNSAVYTLCMIYNGVCEHEKSDSKITLFSKSIIKLFE